MTLGERSLGNVTIVDIEGRITDEDDANLLLRDALQRLIQQGRVNVLLNLADVPYVGSAGLGAIAHAYVSARRRGGTLRLTGVSDRVSDLLTITRLRSVFEVFDSEADALASFRTTRP